MAESEHLGWGRTRVRAHGFGIVLLWLAASSARSLPSQEVLVSSDVTCSTCKFVLGAPVRIGVGTGLGRIGARPSSVVEDRQGRYWVAQRGQPLCIYAPRGTVIRCVGNKGQGACDFSNVVSLFSVPGDSMVVVDQATQRASVIGQDGVVGRTIGFSESFFTPIVINWPSRVVMTGTSHMRASAGWPLHVLSLDGEDTRLLQSFGPDSGVLRPGDDQASALRLAKSPKGGFWSGDMAQYRLVEWRADGAQVRTMRRKPAWFSERSLAWIGNAQTPPPPSLSGLFQDDNGLLWVFLRVAAPAWKSAWANVGGSTGEVSVDKIALERLFVTRVEVIDPRGGTLVASETLSVWVIALLKPGQISTYAVDSLGPRVEVRSLKMTGRGK